MDWVLWGLVWGIAWVVLTGAAAGSRDRSGCGWSLLAVFLGPIALIMVLVMGRGGTAKCPVCRETIRVDAAKCRHCGAAITWTEEP